MEKHWEEAFWCGLTHSCVTISLGQLNNCFLSAVSNEPSTCSTVLFCNRECHWHVLFTWVACGFSVSDRKGTFLDRIRFSPWKMVLFVNHFLSRYWDHKGEMESLHLSSATSVDWRSFCCEVTDYWFANQEAIGGVGVEVEIDETLISRRKYGRGQMRKQIRLGIERVSKRRFVFPLTGSVGHKRNKETLIPLIKST